MRYAMIPEAELRTHVAAKLTDTAIGKLYGISRPAVARRRNYFKIPPAFPQGRRLIGEGKRKVYPKRHLELLEVKTLIAAQKNFSEIRSALKVNSRRLRAFITANGLVLASARGTQSTANRITPGKGGDAEFDRLMGQNSFKDAAQIPAWDSIPWNGRPARQDARSYSGCAAQMCAG